jgi:pilus assembly protein Flp/PilA
MKSLFVRFIREDEGQDLIEYALLATLISVAAAIGAGEAGTSLEAWYVALSAKIDTLATAL